MLSSLSLKMTYVDKQEEKIYIPYPGKLHDLVLQKPVFSASLELLCSRATVTVIISLRRNMLGTVFKRDLCVLSFSGVTDNNIKILTC